MLENKKLTDHFTLYELTKTSRSQFQNENRRLEYSQIEKLGQLAGLLEHVRFILNTPLIVQSGYRCPELNKTVGSTERSQHLLCEAADFIPLNQEIGEAFRKIMKDVKENKPNVGQLIFETANRSYGVTSWIHISLGTPYREAEKCAQILRMSDGKYEFLA